MNDSEIASRPGSTLPNEPRSSYNSGQPITRAAVAFPHQSRPGFYGLSFSEDLRARLTVLVTAMIPGGEGYPSGGDAQVVGFLESRSSEQDRDWLEDVAGRFDGVTQESATKALQELEAGSPELFAALLQFVYHAYYASRRVIAAMADRGYAYHGAPQPLGYVTDPNLIEPPPDRGSYIQTSEVHRVQ